MVALGCLVGRVYAADVSVASDVDPKPVTVTRVKIGMPVQAGVEPPSANYDEPLVLKLPDDAFAQRFNVKLVEGNGADVAEKDKVQIVLSTKWQDKDQTIYWKVVKAPDPQNYAFLWAPVELQNLTVKELQQYYFIAKREIEARIAKQQGLTSAYDIQIGYMYLRSVQVLAKKGSNILLPRYREIENIASKVRAAYARLPSPGESTKISQTDITEAVRLALGGSATYFSNELTDISGLPKETLAQCATRDARIDALLNHFNSPDVEGEERRMLAASVHPPPGKVRTMDEFRSFLTALKTRAPNTCKSEDTAMVRP
jgi:hypothetical protein